MKSMEVSDSADYGEDKALVGDGVGDDRDDSQVFFDRKRIYGVALSCEEVNSYPQNNICSKKTSLGKLYILVTPTW